MLRRHRGEIPVQNVRIPRPGARSLSDHAVNPRRSANRKAMSRRPVPVPSRPFDDRVEHLADSHNPAEGFCVNRTRSRRADATSHDVADRWRRSGRTKTAARPEPKARHPKTRRSSVARTSPATAARPSTVQRRPTRGAQPIHASASTNAATSGSGTAWISPAPRIERSNLGVDHHRQGGAVFGYSHASSDTGWATRSHVRKHAPDHHDAAFELRRAGAGGPVRPGPLQPRRSRAHRKKAAPRV